MSAFKNPDTVLFSFYDDIYFIRILMCIVYSRRICFVPIGLVSVQLPIKITKQNKKQKNHRRKDDFAPEPDTTKLYQFYLSFIGLHNKCGILSQMQKENSLSPLQTFVFH